MDSRHHSLTPSPSSQLGQEANQSVASVPQSDSSVHSIDISLDKSQARQDCASVSEVPSNPTEDQPAQQSNQNTPPNRSSSGHRQSLESIFPWLARLPQRLSGRLDKKRRSCREDREEPKTILRRSRLRSLYHGSVHIAPVIAIGVLMWFNIRQTYIGHRLPGLPSWPDEVKLNLLQVAAKIHEILMIASLATVVCDIVRHHLLFSAYGVPISAVGAGITFSGGTYLFSKEFLGMFKEYKYGHKVVIGLIAILFCVIANSAGPSSAILMIPQIQTWPSAKYDFFLSGTKLEDLCPPTLTDRNIGGPQCNDSQRAIEDPSCAAGAYQSISHYFSSFISYPQGDSFVFDVADALTIRTLQGNVRSSVTYGSETWTMAPHAATVAVQEPIRAVWSLRLQDLSNSNMGRSYSRTGRVDATVPVVRTACVPMRNLSSSVVGGSDSNGGGGKFPMDFPVLSEYDFWYQPPDKKADTFGSGPTQSLNLDDSLLYIGAESNSNRSLIIRTYWVSLPDQFGSVSTGLVILMSAAGEDEEGHGSRFDLGIGCAIDARWAPGQNFVTSSQSDWALAGYSYPTRSSLFGQRAAPDSLGGQHLFLPARDGGWQRIGLSSEWLQALTPIVSSRGTNTSTLDAIFEDTIPALWAVVVRGSLSQAIYDYIAPNRYELLVLAEHAAANLVADGISRTGLYLQPRIWDLVNPLSNLPADTFSLGNPRVVLPAPYNYSEGTRTAPLQIKLTVEGYAYRLGAGVNLFALAVMCTYLSIVVVHVAVIVSKRYDSSTWTTLTEILILALASGPLSGVDRDGATRQMLSCGAAGVERYKTHGHRVFVRVSGAEVKLQLQQLQQDASSRIQVIEGKKYGIKET